MSFALTVIFSFLPALRLPVTETFSVGAIESIFSVRSRLRDVWPARSMASTCHVCLPGVSGVAGTKVSLVVWPTWIPSMETRKVCTPHSSIPGCQRNSGRVLRL